MNHYPHHIGDFDRATRHLTRMERSVYRDLLDLYYDTETRLTLDMNALCRRILARSNEESTAVEQVLNEFFTKTETGWYHSRCDEEISAYHANNSQKAQAGKASAEAKRLRKLLALNGGSTPVESPLDFVTPVVPRQVNGTPTNQNQNQNQNQEGGGEAPDGAPPPSMTGAICVAMKSIGLASVNPSHPDLQVLIDKGADIGVFVDAARHAVAKQKPFSYVLAMVKGRMVDAAALATTALAAPSQTGNPVLNKQQALEASNNAVAAKFIKDMNYAPQ